MVSKVLTTYLLSDSTGKVREIIPVLASYRYAHEFNQLFRSKVRSYRRCSSCHSHNGRDDFLDHRRVCFLLTCKLPPRLGHLLLEFLLERPSLCLGQILHCDPDHVVRPNLGPGSTILQVRHGFNKSVWITDYLAKLGATINT
jgi:hypothetical protein